MLKKEKTKTSRYFHEKIKIDKEAIQRSKILNIILIGLIFLTIVITIQRVYKQFILLQQNQGVSYLVPLIATFILFFLYYISKKGFPLVSGYIVIGFLYSINFYLSYRYGLEVPQTIAMYSLLIVMSGIVLGHKHMLLISSIIFTSLLSLLFLAQKQIINPDISWKYQPLKNIEHIILLITYSVIAIITWLSSKEINKSLLKSYANEKKAKRYAKQLKIQRDTLESTVQQRTLQLQQTQLLQLEQNQSFAEFGKLSAGLLHDINNPLTVILLTLGGIKEEMAKQVGKNQFNDLQEDLDHAILASKKVAKMIKSSKKRIIKNETKENFVIQDEIKTAVILFQHLISRNNILLTTNLPNKNISINGYSAKFSQALSNIVKNSIEAVIEDQNAIPKIQIELEYLNKDIIITVTDNGKIINSELKDKIFEPLYTTKNNSKITKGTGLGLYISKNIIENDFNGKILLETAHKHTSFKIIIPYNIKVHDKKIN